MEILYKELWKLLIDRQMTQTEMRKAALCRPDDIVRVNLLRLFKIRKVTAVFQ